MRRLLLFFALGLWLSRLPGVASGREVVFAGYNVENYAPLPDANHPERAKPGKSAEAAEAVIAIIREINPDILGVAEMGPAPQFAQFRSRLAAAGLGYVDFEYVAAADPDRHLALASRFPIVARNSATDLSYSANGTLEKVRRGILDVTVALGDKTRLRIVGVHLKSKLETRDGEELLRRQEARLLRKHLDAILKADPQTPLLLFGDFNDTKERPAIREVTSVRGAPDALTALPLEDSEGDRWTHYWHVNDTYARIDYLFVNKPLSRSVERARCYLYRKPGWNAASDHRPLVATLRLPDS